MAQKLGILNQLLFGDWAERDAINRNADSLSTVEANVAELRTMVQRQQQEILRLRAMFLGVVEVLQEKVQLDEAELERAVQAALIELAPPPPSPPVAPSDPYRNTPVEPSATDVDAAKALLTTAQDHHFAKRFQEARTVYQQIVEQYPHTKQAGIARQQVDNLRRA